MATLPNTHFAAGRAIPSLSLRHVTSPSGRILKAIPLFRITKSASLPSSETSSRLNSLCPNLSSFRSAAHFPLLYTRTPSDSYSFVPFLPHTPFLTV